MLAIRPDETVQGEPETVEEKIEKIILQNSKKEKKPSVYLYNECIYTVIHPYDHISYAYEYFTYKYLNGKDNSYSYDLTINSKDEEICDKGGSSYCSENKHAMYLDFMKTAKDLTGKSEQEIYAIHKDILRTKICRKLINIPSISKIRERENEHRLFLRDQLQLFFLKVTKDIYIWAEKGMTDIEFTIIGITKDRMTGYGARPQLNKYPCADGVIREDFRDYFYYLFMDIFPHHGDETDHYLWLGMQIMNKLKTIYPHFTVEMREKHDILLPTFIIRMNIQINGLLQ